MLQTRLNPDEGKYQLADSFRIKTEQEQRKAARVSALLEEVNTFGRTDAVDDDLGAAGGYIVAQANPPSITAPTSAKAITSATNSGKAISIAYE